MNPESGWTVLLVAADDIDAQLIAGRLSEEDIPTFFEKDRSGYGDYMMGGSNAHAPVSVLVPQDRLAEARSLLAEVDPESAHETGLGGDAEDDPDVGPAVLARPASASDRLRTLRGWVAIVVVALIVYLLLMEAAPLKDMIGTL